MNLNRMTEIYRRGGREQLVNAIEGFSVTTRAEMLASTYSVSRRGAEEASDQEFGALQSNKEELSY